MKNILMPLVLVLLSSPAWCQHTLKVTIKNSHNLEALPGATIQIKGTSLGSSADEQGNAELHTIPSGELKLIVRFVGFQEKIITLIFPATIESLEVMLEPEEELEEIIITSTRTTRTIEDIPTRVEFIAGEELEEKANMKPGDIRMLLSESTGIQMQQTSATSSNASIRIQGLDGRYTQILKDGFPLYAGFSGGLGLLQTPPLDLKQVEVIKGSSSTLYGGGAIAGMVNLISKTPTEERELKFWLNGTSALGLDINGFYSEQFKKTGITLFVARNSSEAYDPANIDLSAIPKFERYTLNPKMFLELGEATHLDFGLSYITENRIGGDMHYIEGNGNASHSYYEKNNSDRLTTQTTFSHRFNKRASLSVKNSLSYFNRIIGTPGYSFDGVQYGSFTEISYVIASEKSEWISGINIWTDKFSESALTTTPLRNYNQLTVGAFIQNTISISEKVRLESGFRSDYVKDYGVIALPRISLLIKPSLNFSSRIGGGLGYKTPTIFTEESERIQYAGVPPVSTTANTLEKSYGANWDFNYNTSLAGGVVGVSINQLLFYTYINDPLLLVPETSHYMFENIPGYIDSRGTETNAKIEVGHFKLFVGYTYTDTKIHNNGVGRENPLTARHRLNNILMFEIEDAWKIGLEAYYFSSQKLSDNTTGKSYWICGFMIEKLWEHVAVYINFENFLDARQTRFDTIYTGTLTSPVFRDIYAPVDGFVVNGGIKVKL